MSDIRNLENIKYVEKKISYTFHNKDLLIQAFTRRSYATENGGEDNENLEFIGDTVLDFYVVKILIDRFGQKYTDKNKRTLFKVNEYSNEGKLTELKQKFVDKKMLAHRIDILGFSKFLIMGNGDVMNHFENEKSVKEDLFEAIIGAIALDSEWDPDELENSVFFMLNVEHYLRTGFLEEDDYVGLVQNWNQKLNGNIPEYIFTNLENGTFKATVTLKVRDRGYITYTSEGKNKQDARFNVAKNVYNDLKAHNNLLSMSDALPDDITLDNAINVLQELSQKGYISFPEYVEPTQTSLDENLKPVWSYQCIIRSLAVDEVGKDKNKSIAKKKAALECINYIFGNKYNKEL